MQHQPAGLGGILGEDRQARAEQLLHLGGGVAQHLVGGPGGGDGARQLVKRGGALLALALDRVPGRAAAR